MLKKLWQDEVGVIISAELVLVLTIVVLGVSVGLTHVAGSVAQELADVASAFGAMDQGYSFGGLSSATPAKGTTQGSAFVDQKDTCDCEEITFTAPPTPKTDAGDGTNTPENNVNP